MRQRIAGRYYGNKKRRKTVVQGDGDAGGWSGGAAKEYRKENFVVMDEWIAKWIKG